MRWKFVTHYVRDGKAQSMVHIITARTELYAMQDYCNLPAVQDIDYSEFGSTVISIYGGDDSKG